MANTFAFSAKACFGVLDSYGYGENAMIAIMMSLKEAGKIQNGYVRQKDLDKAMKSFGKEA